MTGHNLGTTLHRWMRVAIVATVIRCLAACSTDSTAYDPQSEYLKAVDDAKVVTPGKISRTLTSITNDNPNLIWENGVVGSRLLVVTWLDDNGKGYTCTDPGGCAGDTCKEGGECSTYRWDTWVTVVPEMKRFFAGSQPQPMRIAQLLGLPPSYATPGNPKEAKYFLELWVSPKDLFRPCPDTEISDTACETTFPTDRFRIYDPTKKVRATEGADYGVFKGYSSWFGNRTRAIYSGSAPYPWTRLGYTYDWGSGNHVGLSEFVVNGRREDGSTISVGIKSVSTTTDYFRP